MIIILAEGKGEREAGPQLVRRILHDRLEFGIHVAGRARSTRGKGELIKDYENLVRVIASQESCQGILVLVDSDDDCAKDLAHSLASKAAAIPALVPVVVVCPVKEFENWFVCSAEAVCPTLDPPPPEWDCEVQDAKGWLKACLPNGYHETLDQAQLVWDIDFTLALPRSPSLRRMVNAVHQLIAAIHSNTLIFTP